MPESCMEWLRLDLMLDGDMVNEGDLVSGLERIEVCFDAGSKASFRRGKLEGLVLLARFAPVFPSETLTAVGFPAGTLDTALLAVMLLLGGFSALAAEVIEAFAALLTGTFPLESMDFRNVMLAGRLLVRPADGGRSLERGICDDSSECASPPAISLVTARSLLGTGYFSSTACVYNIRNTDHCLIFQIIVN